jgi:hypothetical protein
MAELVSSSYVSYHVIYCATPDANVVGWPVENIGEVQASIIGSQFPQLNPA